MLEIQFNNSSTATFLLSLCDRWESAVDTDRTLPNDTMDPMGIQTMAVDNSFFAGEGGATFVCCWFHQPTSARFGVKIRETGQPFGMGYQPTWQVMADHAGIQAPANWQDNGNDPAQPYEWDPSIGFQIKANATASHEELTVVVLIRDIPKTTQLPHT